MKVEIKINFLEVNFSISESEDLLKLEEAKDLRKFPFDKLIWMILSYVVLLIVSLFKGTEKFHSLIGVPV